VSEFGDTEIGDANPILLEIGSRKSVTRSQFSGIGFVSPISIKERRGFRPRRSRGPNLPWNRSNPVSPGPLGNQSRRFPPIETMGPPLRYAGLGGTGLLLPHAFPRSWEEGSDGAVRRGSRPRVALRKKGTQNTCGLSADENQGSVSPFSAAASSDRGREPHRCAYRTKWFLIEYEERHSIPEPEDL